MHPSIELNCQKIHLTLLCNDKDIFIVRREQLLRMHGGLGSKLFGACAQNERVVWAWLDRWVSEMKGRHHQERDNVREPVKTV